ncbi:SCP2 sterol-binding domain-containing protein [Streptomyces boninensis]|uniref:SCP2 sterol-binding domain-containing protein n=1 Tax=Streptomyces boninensis TaxID=2039455 RepID=UPI003B21CC16
MADKTKAELESLDFASVSPEEFAKLVKGFSNKEIDELSGDDALRRRIAAEIFQRMESQFRPDAAGPLKAVIRWKITGDSDIVYETAIADKKLTITEGRTEGEPRVTLVLGDAAFLKLVSGNGSPVSMFMTRKLKVAGDVGLAAKLPSLFDIPKA